MGDTLINFEDSVTAAMFDGDVAGDTAGPFSIDGVATLITTSVVSTGFLSTDSFGLGIDSGVADTDPNSFNVGESWSFQTNRNGFLVGLELGGLSPQETFDIQSLAWINLSGVVPGSSVTYVPSTGTFTLVDGLAGDIFSPLELTGGRLLPIVANTDITFGNFTSSFSPIDDLELENMTLRVPEPSITIVLVLTLLAFVNRRTIKQP